MAVKQKLSERIETQLTENGFVHIILPDGGGGYDSYKVSPEVLRDLFKQRYAAQSASFTFAYDAETALESIDIFWVSGTVNVKVGKTLGSNDIISGRDMSASKQESRNLINGYLKTSGTLYFTLTGTGVVDVIINYKKNYNT